MISDGGTAEPRPRLKLLRPLPRSWGRPLTLAVLTAWTVQMGLLIRSSYASANAVALAADLSQYGTTSQWRGIYFHDAKVGFTVSQTIPRDDGYELQEDGQIQMNLLGAITAARHSTRARVDRAFRLRSFTFSLDPGSSPLSVSGSVAGNELQLTLTSPSGTRSETRPISAPPQLALNLPRRLAAEGLEPGRRLEVSVFDPATLSNAPMVVSVGKRGLVEISGRSLPAFRVETEFAGVRVTSWITETGDVLREESPTGLVAVREDRQRAVSLGEADLGLDVLEAAAVVPEGATRIADPTAVKRLRLRVEGVELQREAMSGVGQTLRGDVVEIRDPRDLAPGPLDDHLDRYLGPETLVESDDPTILAAANEAVAGAEDDRTRAERLLRYVNSRLEKRPTVSIPSAREVLKARIGDCNEHTALYVAMARAVGLPARSAVGLVHLNGAFYYHAWPEVFLRTDAARGLWLPVDPTLDQFPADATHLRLLRGGLDRQTEIVAFIGQVRLTILELEEEEQANPVLVGQTRAESLPGLPIDIPERPEGDYCWSRYLP
jgi:hypothetical protein